MRLRWWKSPATGWRRRRAGNTPKPDWGSDGVWSVELDGADAIPLFGPNQPGGVRHHVKLAGTLVSVGVLSWRRHSQLPPRAARGWVHRTDALDIHRHLAYYHRHGAYISWKGFVVIKKPVGVTDAELAVLKVLWARGPLTAKAITESLYPDGAESEFAAVHSFLQRLERKGLVTRDRSAFVHVFSATASQADILGQELNTLVKRLGGDSIAPLIMQLIEQKRLSSKEAAEIRKLLDRYSR